MRTRFPSLRSNTDSRLRGPVTTLAIVCFAQALLADRAAAQDLLVQAQTIVVAPDTVLTNGKLLVRQGKIAYVGSEIPAEARAKATVVDYGTATIVPGFVLATSTLDQERDLAESSFAFTPDLRAAEAFDPWQEALQKLPAAGVTSVALSPTARNVAGGIAALVKPGLKSGQLVSDNLQLVLSLNSAARNQEREPTSLMGAKDLLRTTFATARTGVQGGPDAAVLRQVLQGGRRVFVYADTFVELSAGLDLAKEFSFAPVFVGAREAEKVISRLVQQKAGIVLDTLSPDAREAQLRLPTLLAEAGVPFCFGGRPDQLRLSAALAVHAGLDRKVALQALTRMPAVLLDQQTAVGSLRQGNAADFLVFAGDPLDLSTTHLGTWIAGERIVGDAPSPVRATSSVRTTTATTAPAGGQ